MLNIHFTDLKSANYMCSLFSKQFVFFIKTAYGQRNQFVPAACSCLTDLLTLNIRYGLSNILQDVSSSGMHVDMALFVDTESKSNVRNTNVARNRCNAPRIRERKPTVGGTVTSATSEYLAVCMSLILLPECVFLRFQQNIISREQEIV